MKKCLIIFCFLISCSSNQNQLKNNYSDFRFNEDLSFEEFKIKLEDYALNSPYPNIDN